MNDDQNDQSPVSDAASAAISPMLAGGGDQQPGQPLAQAEGQHQGDEQPMAQAPQQAPQWPQTQVGEPAAVLLVDQATGQAAMVMQAAEPNPEGTPLELAIARVCHEVNRHYCMSLGDYSQPIWDALNPELQNSAIEGVKAHLRAPDLSPRQSHENWMAYKKATGWKYGPTKDVAKREHPCMVEYDRLPPEQRAKDYIFKGVVVAIAREQVSQ